MKKLLVIGALCAASALGAYAYIFETWCGIKVQTVDQEAFEDPDDATEFYGDLNEYYCGAREAPAGSN